MRSLEAIATARGAPYHIAPASKGNLLRVMTAARQREVIMPQLEPLLVDRNQLRKLGVTLSWAEIDRRERRGSWPKRIKAGRHTNSRVYYRYPDIVALIEKWAAETKPLQDDES
jgi:hypothetical protein